MIAIATGLVVVQGVPSNTQYVQQEAKKLSQILWLAQLESKLRNQTLRLSLLANGFEFLYEQNNKWVRYPDDEQLRPRKWDPETLQVQLLESNRTISYLDITPRPHLKNQQIQFKLNEASIRLNRKFNGRFELMTISNTPNLNSTGYIQ